MIARPPKQGLVCEHLVTGCVFGMIYVELLLGCEEAFPATVCSQCKNDVHIWALSGFDEDKQPANSELVTADRMKELTRNAMRRGVRVTCGMFATNAEVEYGE